MKPSIPGPWVNHEIKESEPWRDNGGIVKFIEFPVRIPEMSHRAFHLYWQRHHSPNVMNVTPFAQFIRKYNSTHRYPGVIAGLPEGFNQNTPFEGAAEVWINSLEEVGSWLSHPLYPELIQPDEPRFIRQDGQVEILITKEERLYEPTEDMTENGLTKVHLLVKRSDRLDRNTFHAALSAHGRKILQQSTLRSRLRKLVISHKLFEPQSLEGLKMAETDAVVELWFENVSQIAEFFSDPSYQSAIAPEQSSMFNDASSRAVVAKVRVVHDEFSFQPSTTQPFAFSWKD